MVIIKTQPEIMGYLFVDCTST